MRTLARNGKFLNRWVHCSSWVSNETFFCVGENETVIYVWYNGEVHNYSKKLGFSIKGKTSTNDKWNSYRKVLSFKSFTNDETIKWIR